MANKAKQNKASAKAEIGGTENTTSTLAVTTLVTTTLPPASSGYEAICKAMADGGTVVTDADTMTSFIDGQMDAAGSGMRNAILALDVAIRTSEELAEKVCKSLMDRAATGTRSYSPQTVAQIKQCAVNYVPLLREKNLLGYRDIFNLRDVGQALASRGEVKRDHPAHCKIIEAIRRGESAAKLRDILKENPDTSKSPRKPAGKTAQSGVKSDDVSEQDKMRRALDIVAELIDQKGFPVFAGEHSFERMFSAKVKTISAVFTPRKGKR